jgi:hypothetical protein
MLQVAVKQKLESLQLFSASLTESEASDLNHLTVTGKHDGAVCLVNS